MPGGHGDGSIHRDLRLVIVGRQIGERNRPVEQRRPGDLTIGCARLEFIVLEARRCTRPMGGGTADGLDDPRWQAGEVLGYSPGTAGGASIKPSHLLERFPFVIVVVLVIQIGAGFEKNAGNTRLGQLIGQRPAARSRSDDHDSLFVFCDLFHWPAPAYSSILGSGSHVRSLKPRLR